MDRRQVVLGKRLLVDESGDALGSVANPLHVDIAAADTITVNATNLDISMSHDSDSVLIYGNDGTDNRELKTDADGHAQVDVLTVPLPTGAATQATLATLDGKVTACNTGAVVLAAGSAAIGKLAANSGVDIGDVDVTSLPSAIEGAGSPSVDSSDSAVVDCGADATTQVIAAPGEGKQLHILGLMGTADTVDTTIVLKSATTAKTGTCPMADNGGFVLPISGNFALPWIKCTNNEAFQITTANGTFDGVVVYAIVSVS